MELSQRRLGRYSWLVQRIIAGSHRGRRLLDLPTTIDCVRPTGARVRGAIFNRLQREVVGATVLDLFAGSGAMGLEALSRGAAHATLVERDRRVHAFLRRQVDALGLADKCTIVQSDAVAFVSLGPERRYDLVFVDPPYAQPEAYLAVANPLLAGAWLADDAVVVFEHDTVKSRADIDLCPPGYRVDAQRRYGQTAVDFLSQANR